MLNVTDFCFQFNDMIFDRGIARVYMLDRCCWSFYWWTSSL